MKKIHYALLILCSLCFLHGYAQTADEVISKHLENTGGKEKLSSVTSFTLDFTMNIMGTDAPSTAVVLVGKGLRSEMDFGGQKVITVVTDKNGWTINPLAGITEPRIFEQQEYLESKDQLDFTPFIDYQLKGSKLELVGKEKLDNEDVYKIIFTNRDNLTTTCYFNANTFYLVKTVRKLHVMGQETEVVTTYSDFRKTDNGLVGAFRSNADYGQFQLVTIVNKIEFNKPIDVSVFEMKK
jgi:outer membrane lipoprotein-sorting protein